MDKPVHLSWPSHKNTLTALFFTYRLNNTFCDVTICCNGVYFPAHRLILSTFSMYFKEILEMVPCKHPYIIVQDIHVDDLKDLLDFIYVGEITIENHRMESFFKVAKNFGINGADTKENFLLFNTPVDSGRLKINVDMTPKQRFPSKLVEEDPLATIYIQNFRTVFKRDLKTAFTNKFEDTGSCSEDFKICDDLKLEREQTETCSQNAIVEELFQPTNHSDCTRNEEVESLLHNDDIKIEVDDVFGHSRTPSDDMEVSEGNPVNFNEEISLADICKNSDSCERDNVSQDQISVISPFLKHEVEEETDAYENGFNENETEKDYNQEHLHFITEKFSDNMNEKEKNLEIQQKKASFESSEKVFSNFGSSKASDSRKHARKNQLESSHFTQECTLKGINSLANESYTRDRSLHENSQKQVIDEEKYSFERDSEIKAPKQKYILKDISEEGRVFVCRLCPFVSSSQTDFMYHKNDHRRNSHHCSICPYRANTKLSLIRHVELHKSARKHQCNLCSYVTSNKHQLEYHLNIHSGDMPYKCDVCPYESKGKSNLVAHIRRHSLVKVHENKSSIDESKVSLNMEEIYPSNEYRSTLVNDDNITVMEGANVINEKTNSSTRNKSSGMWKKCGANNTPKSIKVDKEFYQCSICPYKAIKKCTITRHTMQVHAFNDVYVRKKSCGKKRTKDCLTKSSRTKHSSDNYDRKGIVTEDKPGMCDSVETKLIITSDQRGDDEIDLNKFNEQNITGEKVQKRFKCSLFSFSSINETKLKKHKKRHINKMFKCQLCPYQHHNRPYYVRHMKMHNKIDGFKYRCDKCLYGANSEHLIRYHQNVHSGEKPFKCDQCKFAAVDKGHLTQHILRKH